MAFFSANIQGLCPAKGKHKINFLNEMALEENIGLLIITETHLSEDHIDGEINMKGYSHYAVNRAANAKRGGVIVYIRDDLAPGTKIVTSGSIGNIEFLVLYLKSLNITLVSIYRPPSSEFFHFDSVMNEVRLKIDEINMYMPKIIFSGDLNFPIINWDDLAVNGGTASDRRQAANMIGFFQDYFLEQYVKHPTRGNNILDLFATNEHELVSRIIIEDTKLSDHKFLIIN